VEDAKRQLAKERAEVDEKWKQLDEERKKIIHALELKKVRLNVGGKSFTTSLSTLTSTPSMLATMFSGKFDISKDDEGEFFVDRDGTHFGYILNFLRDGDVDLPDDPLVLKALTREVEYYNIISLLDLLKPQPQFENQDWTFDVNVHSQNIALSNNNQTATHVGFNSVHCFVVGEKCYTTGKYAWTCQIDRLFNNHWMLIGIAEGKMMSDFSYSDPSCFGIAGGNQFYVGGNCNQSPTDMKQGDTIHVLLDCDARILKVRNMRNLSSDYQWRNLPAVTPLTLHCNLYNPGDEITATPISVQQFGI